MLSSRAKSRSQAANLASAQPSMKPLVLALLLESCSTYCFPGMVCEHHCKVIY